ncbi:hypothetical protein [Heliophilum fasciatum]|nr:hypothetical protein [Heliophilum fasciatum]MCW2279070.1 hypothetical protein [Heliophilum fasciatum]
MIRNRQLLPLILSLALLFPISVAAATDAVPLTPPTTPTPAPSIQRIPLTPAMIHDEVIAFYSTNYITRATALVDEQTKVPVTPSDKLTQTFTSKNWVPTMQKPYLPIAAYIDLGTTYKITHIAYYDANGTPTIEFYQGAPFAWQKIFSTVLNTYNTWKVRPVDVETRYLRIMSPDSCDSGIKEIALYGYQTGPDPVPAGEPTGTKPNFGITADQAIGINAFIDDPLDKMKVAGHIREYHNWSWTGPAADQDMFNPSAAGKWDFDSYYKKLKDAGIEVIPCIQGNANWILGAGQTFSSKNNKPLPPDRNAEVASSYREHAAHLYQYAARYGTQPVDSSRLTLADDQVKKSGLGLLKYYENNNEPDKTWEGRSSYFSPYEFAAMCSADYDGHEGTMGPNIGIKNADPQAKLVMGGLAGIDDKIEYLELMKFWFEHNRKDRKFAPDVLNLHYYTGKESPEKGKLKNKVAQIVQWRNQNLPDKEVWLTEFGWDTNSHSPLAAPSPDVQGQWLVRGYLATLAAGVDRATMYMIRDVASWSGEKYASSGLVGQKYDWTPKPSWYYVYTMKNTLKGMVFDRAIKESENLYIYKFVSGDSGSSTTSGSSAGTGSPKECYVLWCPTSDGTKLDNYRLSVGTNKKAYTVTLEEGFTEGIKASVPVDQGNVLLNVTEKPLFLMVTGQDAPEMEPTSVKIPIDNARMYSNNPQALVQFKRLADEQSKAPQGPAAILRKTFTTQFDDIWPLRLFPLSAYVDLGRPYRITHIGFYDSTGRGLIKFYKGAPQRWDPTPDLVYDLYFYNQWVVKEAGFTTRYLNIEKYGNEDLYEIALYGYPVDEEPVITEPDSPPPITP